MSQALIFQSTTFDVVDRSGQPWIQSRQLASALGYKDENSVRKIYERNVDEFTDAMTATVKMTVGITPVDVRIFSLRGCHLLAMFARTPVAKAFRVWVLDVLDKLNAERSDSISAPSPISKRTDPERKALTSIINTWVGMAPIHYAAARAQVNAHFGVASVDAMTVAQVKEAIQYVQGKIDALPAAPAALPPASGTAEVEAQLANIRAHVREIMACERRMYFTLRDTLPPLRGVTRPLALCLYESMDAGSVLLDAALKQVENTARLVIEYGRG